MVSRHHGAELITPPSRFDSFRRSVPSANPRLSRVIFTTLMPISRLQYVCLGKGIFPSRRLLQPVSAPGGTFCKEEARPRSALQGEVAGAHHASAPSVCHSEELYLRRMALPLSSTSSLQFGVRMMGDDTVSRREARSQRLPACGGLRRLQGFRRLLHAEGNPRRDLIEIGQNPRRR